ncbi:hypothetical protein TG1_41 [Streptomyces phage TG1]|uniref:Uncharacterized protein n=1 Tax=Streptomyces phage TG1 TaxID=2927987 RepID=K4HYL4_9CAUD|nr:hypothetical protein D281_gp41 [Streptomyces phage TG1]AFU62236.1 hypothetical protein TG1_41 [Streptomyces phage TG1]
MTTTTRRPATKAAKNLKAGDWVTFGRLAYRVHADAVLNDDGTVWVAMGPLGSEFRAAERVAMHYND